MVDPACGANIATAAKAASRNVRESRRGVEGLVTDFMTTTPNANAKERWQPRNGSDDRAAVGAPDW